MHIGFFVDTFFPMIDGVVMVVDNYARCLSRKADVTVFTVNSGVYDFSSFPYHVERCKALQLRGFDYCVPIPDVDLPFRQRLEESRLDIVHIHSPFLMGEEGVRYARRHAIPVVGTLHSQYKQDMAKVFKQDVLIDVSVKRLVSIFDSLDECWTVNKGMASLYVDEYGGKRRPLVQLNATDLAPCPNPEEAMADVNSTYGIAPSDTVLLFVGRINKIKNILLTAKALGVLKQHGKVRFKMLFVGTGQDEAELEKTIKSLDIGDDVIMCGKVTDRAFLTKIYCRADLFLFPSKYDANSLVQIEAASQGTPTVFLRGTITSSTVVENVSGFFCDDSPESLAEKVEEIMSDKELYHSVSERVKKDIYRSWDMVTDEVYERYQLLVEKRKRQEKM